MPVVLGADPENLTPLASLDERAKLLAGNTPTLVLVPISKGASNRSRSDAQRLAQASRSPEVAAERTPRTRLAEASGLARAIDLDVRDAIAVPLGTPRPATLLGSGKVEEIALRVATDELQLVIVDHPLTPGQQRNLERAWQAKVLDRTGLILEIFGRRAKTREGRLQVELAHLNWQKSRLVRSWTHLERQRGGFGFVGGPGETQMEADRRIIQDRIDAIRRELSVVVRTRSLHRQGRDRVPYPVVALVGYTNAGKSTLFNHLTGAAVVARDQLFATLDPTMREIVLPGGRRAILSDTVGFVSELPTTLIAAFRATLEEVVEADLILHVRDMADENTQAQRADVLRVLRELEIGPVTGEAAGVPLASAPSGATVIEVWNKIDLLTSQQRDALAAAALRETGEPPCLVSSLTGEGTDELLMRLGEMLSHGSVRVKLSVAVSQGKFIHWLHENTEVLTSERDSNGVQHMEVRVDDVHHGRLLAHAKKLGKEAVDIQH